MYNILKLNIYNYIIIFNLYIDNDNLVVIVIYIAY